MRSRVSEIDIPRASAISQSEAPARIARCTPYQRAS
ncbi:hypothetical protein SAMN02745831_07329 [Streptomyces sp. PgraA7]|nr:hypothetical protein SAMN02745831_07329 [Streptomyces sp. PgraA7]